MDSQDKVRTPWLSRIRGLRGARRKGGGRRPTRTPSGLAVIPREPHWTPFDLGRPTPAVEIACPMDDGQPGHEKTIIARVRMFDREGGSLDHLIVGLRSSENAGKYFYPLEYVRDGVMRFAVAAPPRTARVEVALQHWAKSDPALYGHGRLTLTPVAAAVNAPSRIAGGSADAAREKLREAEADLRQALRRYAERLTAAPGPLHADEAAFGEPLAEYLIHDEGRADLGARLAGRRLRAGRDREAIALIGLSDEPELIKAQGRRRLFDHASAQPATRPAQPRIRHRSLIYLAHNALPYDTGGYAARSHGLLRGYVKAGWDVMAVTRPGYPADRGHTPGPARQVIDGVAYHILPEDGGVDGPDQVAYVERFAQGALRLAEGREIGVVQAASFAQNALAGRKVADGLGAPLVYEMRGMEWLTRSSSDPRWLDSDQCRMMADLERLAARQADHVFTITGALREWVIASGVEAERISLLPNGCSPDQFTPRPRDEALAEELGLGQAHVMAYIGSFAAYEGIPEIITAVGRARELSGLDIRLLLVGDGQSAPAIEQHILEAGASDHVVRTGRVAHDRIPALYSLVDALVLARRDTTLTQMISPLKPLEALAMGKHVISTDVAAVREILDAAGAGRLVAPNAPYGLAHAMAEAARDRDALRGRAEATRAWAMTERDWSVLAKRALDTLEGRFGVPARPATARRQKTV